MVSEVIAQVAGSSVEIPMSVLVCADEQQSAGRGSDLANFIEIFLPAIASYCAISSSLVVAMHLLRCEFWWRPSEVPVEYLRGVSNQGRTRWWTDARFWYRLHNRVTKESLWAVWGLPYFSLIGFFAISSVWILLGMFLEPEKVAPYGTGARCAHVGMPLMRGIRCAPEPPDGHASERVCVRA